MVAASQPFAANPQETIKVPSRCSPPHGCLPAMRLHDHVRCLAVRSHASQIESFPHAAASFFSASSVTISVLAFPSRSLLSNVRAVFDSVSSHCYLDPCALYG